MLYSDCVNRTIPPNKTGLLERSLASPSKDNTGSVAFPPPHETQDPFAPSPAGHTRSRTAYFAGVLPKSGLQRLLMEKWAQLESMSHPPWQTWLR